MAYDPKLTQTSGISLPRPLAGLLETLARHNHDVWARQRMDEGWTYGHARDDRAKTHPDLVPYDALPESEKQYDRNTALETLKLIVAYGYDIVPPSDLGVADDELAELQRRLGDPSERKPSMSVLLRHWEGRDRAEWRRFPRVYRLLAEHLLRMGEPLVAYAVSSEALDATRRLPLADDDVVRLRQIQGLALARAGSAEAAQAILIALVEEGHADEETLGILARTYKDLAFRSPDPGRRASYLALAFKEYLAAYQRTQGFWVGINAATIAVLRGERETAASLAGDVAQTCLHEVGGIERTRASSSSQVDTDQLYWALATVGEAALIMGNENAACDHYRKAVEVAGDGYGLIASTRRNARLLTGALGVGWAAIDASLPLPRVMVFAGHMIDRPTRPAPRFPARLEEVIRDEILARLRPMGRVIGFGSAACGADILFLEAVLEQGGDAHVVLPYDRQQFTQDAVDIHPGGDWAQRFHRVLERATEVTTISPQKLPWGNLPYEHANKVLLGLAMLHARRCETTVTPMAVWDGNQGDGEGGTASAVQLWNGAGLRWEWIDLSSIVDPGTRGSREPANLQPPPATDQGREGFHPALKAVLFADVKGFSKLSEEQIPLFVDHLLGLVGELAVASPWVPVMKNSWGDGLYLVFDTVEQAGCFALELARRVTETDWVARGLPVLGIRTALHAGPVYRCIDPVTQKENYTGTHVSRAARIEPITPVNQVYASQEFAAAAAADGVAAFLCEYVGVVATAKEYGRFPMYHVRRIA